MILQGEELQFAISQYLDGTLSPVAAAAVEERLAADVAARELLREYRQLGTTMRENLPGVPAIDFKQFSSSILIGARSVGDRSSVSVLRMFDRSAVGNLVRPAGIGFRRPLALAASLLIACTLIAVFVARPKSSAPVARVVGPQIEQSSGPVIAEVSIGPAPSLASINRLNHEDAIDRPSIVLIDRADNPAPDGDSIY